MSSIRRMKAINFSEIRNLNSPLNLPFKINIPKNYNKNLFYTLYSFIQLLTLVKDF